MFQVGDSALVPPDSIPFGEDVTIDMQVDFDPATKNMQFTFGPHGTRLERPAHINLHYQDMGIERPKLYYIDEAGNQIPQTPDDIDVKKRFMIIYIHHFSRYILAHS